MTIIGRTHRPVVDRERCGRCSVCVRGCPAEILPELRSDLDTTRGYVYANVESIRGNTLPPCTGACPLGQQVQEYVQLLHEGRIREALLVIRQDNPLPGVCGYICHHPCEQACVLAGWDEPVAIRELKRYAIQYERDHREETLDLLLAKKAGSAGKKVVMVGAGPAGLACGFELVMAGYQVHVLDALPKPGGMLIGGIPAFRLPRWVVDHDVDMIRSLGVDFIPSFRLGKDATIQGLMRHEADAFVLATGAWKDLTLEIEGEGIQGSLSCLEFLERVHTGKETSISGRVLVVGGGNAAIDTARCALRLGAREVIILYRRSREEMPAIPEEVEAAIHEGIRIEYLVAPKRILSNRGKVTGLELMRTEIGSPDESGRRRPVPVEGSEYVEPADMVIAAIGQRPDLAYLEDGAVTPWGGISCDQKGMVSGVHGVFAAGDAVTGPSTVVEALASGKATAHSVMRYLKREE